MVLRMQKYLCATSFALLQVGFASTEELSTVLSEEISPTPDGTTETEIPRDGTTAGHGGNVDFETTNAHNDHDDDGLMRILMFVSPIIILLLLIPLIYCIVKRMRWKKDEKDEDTAKDENIKSPIFEEDTPSVMEIEMEDLEKWMNNMKENGRRLSVLEEEGKFQTSLSDNDHEDNSFDMAIDCPSLHQKENI